MLAKQGTKQGTMVKADAKNSSERFSPNESEDQMLFPWLRRFDYVV